VFRSRKAVIEHMRKVGTYTEEDIRIVESGNVKIKPKSVESSIRKNACWTESESLPQGWKLKEEGENGRKRSMFLSPEGKIFWTRFQVLEGMAKSGKYTTQDFAKVREAMNENPPNTAKVSKLATVSKPCTLLPNTPLYLPQTFSPANTQDNQSFSNLPLSSTVSSHSQQSPAFSQTQCSASTPRSPTLSSLPPASREIFMNGSISARVTLQANTNERSETQAVVSGTAFINSDQNLAPPEARVTQAGRPTILQAKQEKKTTNTSKPRTSDVGWKTCNSTLPAGWKTRTHFWSDREKHVYLSPKGKTFASRKSMLAYMELAGTYSKEDFVKVKKALQRKRKRKINNQWVPLKRKTKLKKNETAANKSFNKNENHNAELVKAGQDAVLEPVEDLLKSDDENESNVDDKSENSDLLNKELENTMEKDLILNSIKPCVVNLERLQDSTEG